MVVEIEVPDTIGEKLKSRGPEIRRQALEALAIAGYQDGVLTTREVQELLHLSSRWEADSFLKQAGAWMDYGEGDAHQDAETLQGFLNV